MLLAYEKGVGQGAFNIGSGRGYSIREVVVAVLAATGHDVDVNWDTTKPTGEARKVADITKARELLGYDPKVGLPEAIALTVDWFRRNRETGRRSELRSALTDSMGARLP